MRIALFLLWLLLLGLAHADLKVASLHPLMGDLARQVGGDHVTVVDIGKPGMNVHDFAPKASDLKKMSSCQLVLASGKNLERYLGGLKDSLGGIPIVEVGRKIPSRKISGDDSLYVCCPNHSTGAIDPHWWHDVENMERAAKIVADTFAKADPSQRDYYKSRGREVAKKYAGLDSWAKRELAKVPRVQRKLVTAHAAFGYFCKAYKFESVFVLGMSGDHEVPARQLATEIEKLKKEQIRAIFPEKNSNPKVLSQIAKQTGARIGKPLIADGSIDSYDNMVHQNIRAIVAGLSQ